MSNYATYIISYYKEFRTLSQQEEVELFLAIDGHPERVLERDIFVKAQMYWVAVAVYSQYKTISPNDIADLMSEANLLLLQLVDSKRGHFDPSLGVRFSAYAKPIILREIGSIYKNKIKLSSAATKAHFRSAHAVMRLKEELRESLGYEPSLEQITLAFYSGKDYSGENAAKLAKDKKKICKRLSLVEVTLSYDSVLQTEENEASLIFAITDGKTAEESLLSEEIRRYILKLLNSLTDKERYIVCHYLAIYGYEELSIAQIASHYGVSRQAIHNTYTNIKKKLTTALNTEYPDMF